MFRFVFSYLKSQKNYFFLYILLMYIITLIGLANPLITAEIINVISGSKLLDDLINLGLLLGSLTVGRVIIQFIAYKFFVKIQTLTAFTINSKVLRHIQNLPLNDVEGMNTTYVNQRVNSDSNTITSFVMNFCTEFGTNIITILFSIIVVVQIHNIIALIMFGVLILYLFFYILLRKKIYTMSYLFKESQAEFFAVLTEQLENIKFLQIYVMEKLFYKKLANKFELFLEKVMKSQMFFYLYNSLESIINGIMQVTIYMLGGILVLKNEINIGEFMIIINFFSNIMSSIKYFSDLGKEYQENLTSFDRIKEYLNKNTYECGEILLDTIMNIECKNITFMRGERKIIDDFSYVFVKGKIYGLKGRNGSGKTTLINIILGLYKCDCKGKIYYNSVDTKEIDMKSIRQKQVAVIEQEPYMFQGTIEQNIILDKNYRKCALANFLEKTKMLELPLSKEVYIDGKGLSGGEKQKIALLRLSSKEADVLILDEPTSALDVNTSETFMRYIQGIKKEKIIIIVSHDEKLDCLYDEVVLLSK